MANFPGGSAFAMARDIAEGYFTVTERSFQRMERVDLDRITFEMGRLLRDVRSQQPDLEDIAAIKERNRKIQRINSALMILRAFRLKRRI